MVSLEFALKNELKSGNHYVYVLIGHFSLMFSDIFIQKCEFEVTHATLASKWPHVSRHSKVDKLVLEHIVPESFVDA